MPPRAVLRSRLDRPHFVVVGAMKAGTTSVYGQLLAHPDIGGPRRKELNWFSVHGRNAALPYKLRFLFVPGAIVGEASPSYSEHPSFGPVARRMYGAVPDARLVYCVRDPIDRMLSHYRHEVIQGRERRPAADALDDTAYLLPSLFGRQLAVLRRWFPAAQIALVSAPGLAADDAVSDLHAFVGASAERSCSAARAALYVSGERDAVPLAATRVSGSPLGRIAASLLPRGAKDRIRSGLSRLGTDDGDLASGLIGGSSSWSPPPHVVAALDADRALLAEASRGCHWIGVDPAEWVAPGPDRRDGDREDRRAREVVR